MRLGDELVRLISKLFDIHRRLSMVIRVGRQTFDSSHQTYHLKRRCVIELIATVETKVKSHDRYSGPSPTFTCLALVSRCVEKGFPKL